MELKISRIILDKMNTQSISMLIALVIVISGIIMVILQIRDEGLIDIKSSIVSGQVKSGLVGISLIFLGVFVVIFGLALRKRTKIEITKGDMKVSYSGHITHSICRSFIEDTFTKFLARDIEDGTTEKDRAK